MLWRAQAIRGGKQDGGGQYCTRGGNGSDVNNHNKQSTVVITALHVLVCVRDLTS